MSRVYFQEKGDGAEVFGSERAHAGMLIDTLGKAMLGVYDDDPVLGFSLSKFLPPDAWPLEYINKGDGWGPLYIARLALYLSSHGDERQYLQIGEQRYNPWHIYLNTAITVGPDPIRFMARLHATCELHGYVEGPHRAWLADIIEDGLAKFMLREAYGGRDRGWRSVIALLRVHDDGPVVMSYSVTDDFPNSYIARFTGTDAEWYEKSYEEQWELAIAGLRKQDEEQYIEMRPDTFRELGFGDGVDAFMFLDEALTYYEAHKPAGESPR